MHQRPMVGMLYNPTVPIVLDAAGDLVDYVEVVPDRLWYDFGVGAQQRFSPALEAIRELLHYKERYRIVGHGIGLSLPSAMPLDEVLLDQVVASHADLEYEWYSEHLSVFLFPNGAVPNAQAGLGLPVILNEESLGIVGGKTKRLSDSLGCPVLMENGTIFSEIPEQQMSEPEFFNRLFSDFGCGMLLDLHNLYANTLNLGTSASDYLAQLSPTAVWEIHLAGGDRLRGHYTDSHSRRTPDQVWEWAHSWAPLFPNLRAITFEYHESYHTRLGVPALVEELGLMHDLASAIAMKRMASTLSHAR